MRRAKNLQICTKLLVLLLLVTPSFADEPTNRDAAIQFLAESLGTECEQETIDRLGISKEQCDQRHVESIQQCEVVAVSDLPPALSGIQLRRLMLRLSFCRFMVMQGEEFDLTAWDTTITQILEGADEEE